MLRRFSLSPMITTLGTLMFALGSPSSADANLVLVDNATPGFYNQAIGTVLDRTNPVGNNFLFPGANLIDGDPTFNPVPFEPNLIAAAPALGNWLGNPSNLGANWSFQNIPSAWALNTETAIIYAINAGSSILQNVVAEFGVDNGLFVWLDGVFRGGQVRPGGAVLGELTINLGDLGPGVHYLQLLREDHGVAAGYSVRVTAVPEPATICGLALCLLNLAGYRYWAGGRGTAMRAQVLDGGGPEV